MAQEYDDHPALGRMRVAGDMASINIDSEQSFLEGWVSAADPTCISWSIEVVGSDATIDTPTSETAEEAEERLSLAEFISNEGCNAEIRRLMFRMSNGRELDGVSAAIDFDASDMHPILPDNPANFYYGTVHHVPEHTRITIGSRYGRVFRVVWQFRPERFAGDAGGEVEIDAYLALQAICVYFPDGQVPREDVARACACHFTADGDLGVAVVDRNWVRIAVKPDVR